MRNNRMLDMFNLNKDQPKISSQDSERAYDPKITIELAKERLESINCNYDIEIYNIDNTFWTSELKFKNIFDLDLRIQPSGPLNGGKSTMGKGSTQDQCVASNLMETIERISIWQHMCEYNPVYHGINLRTGNIEKVSINISTSEKAAAGNTYEEATLHALHEMIEVDAINAATVNMAANHTAFLKPFKVIDFKNMYPSWPSWVFDSFVILQSPTTVPEFYNFLGLHYPITKEYGQDWKYEKNNNDNVWSKQPINYTNWRGKEKTAYVFSVAGLNPSKAISRVIQENFQGPIREPYSGIKKTPPEWLKIVDGVNLKNYETDSITKDIKFIVSKIPEQFNVWAVDISSPELGVPVVMVVSDYHMPQDISQKRIFDMFFEV